MFKKILFWLRSLSNSQYVMPLIFLFSAGIMIYPNYTIPLAIFLLSIYLFSLFLEKRTGILLFGCLSIFFHLLLFPLVYLTLMRIDPNSFEINQNVVANETRSAEDSLKEKYRPSVLAKEQDIIRIILNSKDTDIEKHYKYLKDGNIINLDGRFLIFESVGYELSKVVPPGTRQTISVANWEGRGIVKLSRLDIREEDKSIRTILKGYKQMLNSAHNDYIDGIEAVVKKDVWNYLTLTPYVINIYDSGNFNPVTKISNLVYQLHLLIVSGLLLSAFISSMQTILLNKSNSSA